MSNPRWIRRRETKLVLIGPAVWQLPQTFECLTPNPSPKCPPCVSRSNVFGYISIPRWICRCVPNLVPIGPAVWQLLQTFEFVTPYPPPPPEMPPGVLRGDLYLAYVHSQMNPQTWPKVGANRTASPDFWIVDPLKPAKCPLVYPVAICLANIHSHMNLHMCAKFGANRPSFSRMCAKVSSAFRRCTRWLAQKHAKKQHLFIENYNSGPNMQTSTSLSFITAIFVAFSDAVAEKLIIFCRHVRTEYTTSHFRVLVLISVSSRSTST